MSTRRVRVDQDFVSRLYESLDARVARGGWPSVALLLFCVATLLRLPFFFQAVLSWDESTYILLGQDLLNGNLPYDRFWDVKPPLAYLAFAASISLFGHAVEGVRLAGTLCIASAAYAVYLASRHKLGSGRAATAGVIAIVAVVQQEAGQATMTEHFAIVPLSAAFALLVIRGEQRWAIAVSGLLLASATLIRTNLAYVSLLVALAVMIRPGRGGLPNRFRDLLALGLPAAAVLLLCVMPYAAAGKLTLLRGALIDAPLAYSQVQHGAAEAILKLARGIAVRSNPALAVYVWGAGLAGSVWIAWAACRCRTIDGLDYWLLIFIVAATYSVLASGGGYGHYLIQLAPFYAVASVWFATSVVGPAGRSMCLVLACVAAVWAVKPVAVEYTAVADRLSGGAGLRSGRALSVAQYIASEVPPGAPVYLMEDQLAYWLLGTEPLTRMTAHPSNFSKPFMLRVVEGPTATPASELRRVFALRPLLVIKPETVQYLDGDPAARAVLSSELANQYARVAMIDGLIVYRRVHQ